MDSCQTEDHPEIEEHAPPTFLTIPLEIRHSIYSLVLGLEASYYIHYSAITIVNHQTRNESLPVLWGSKGSIVFRRIETLFRFVAKVPSNQLQMVKKIYIDLDTTDLEKIAVMTPLENDVIGAVNKLTSNATLQKSNKDWMHRHEELCQQHLPNKEKEHRWTSRFFYQTDNTEVLEQKQAEAEELEKQKTTLPSVIQLLSHSLLTLSNVQEVEINVAFQHWFQRAGKCPNWTPEQHLLLEMLADSMPNIRSLVLHLEQAHLLPLTILSDFRNIRALSIEVYTKSSSNNALKALLSLPFLEDLTLTVNKVGMYRDKKHRVNARINADVIAGLRPLKRLSIEDGTDDVPSTSPNFKWLSVDIVQAIAATHSQSLKDFNISSNWMTGITNPAVFDEVLKLLPTMEKLQKAGVCFRVPEEYRTEVGENLAGFMPADVRENRCRIEWEDEVLTGYYSKMYYGS